MIWSLQKKIELFLQQRFVLSAIYPIGFRKCHRGKCYHVVKARHHQRTNKPQCHLFSKTGSN